MKKKITWLLCIVLAVMLAVPVFAAEKLKVTTSSNISSSSSGNEITVTVSAEVDQCGQGGIEITYDTKVFELVSGKCLLEGTFFDDFDTSSKDGVFVFEEDSAISGAAFEFILKVKDGASLGTSRITVKFTADNKTASSDLGITVVCRHSYTDDCDTTCDLCAAVREVTHTWDKGTVTTKPTCTGEGVKTFTCTRCGETKTESVKATGHSYDDGVLTTQPTCTGEGVKTFTCTSCGKTKTESVAAAGHSYDSGTVTTEPTCTEAGVKTLTCTSCGKTKTEAVEATGHDYDKGTVTEEATCTGEGVKTRTCKNCGSTKTSSIESKGHSYDEGVVTQEATCTSEGEIKYTCTVCGKVKKSTLDLLDHQYDNDCDEECNTCGQTRQVEHDYAQTGDGEAHWQECTKCQAVQNREEHSCETEISHDDALHGYVCTVCGMLGNSEEHAFDSECDGVCDVCGYTRAVTHYYSNRWTYNTEGHWYECILCGDQLEMELHEPGEEATETTDQFCMICGYIIQIAGNHEHTMAGDWLCDESGHWFQCSCLEYTDPADHVWDEGVIDEEDLVIVYTCTDCGYFMTETYIPATEPAPTDPTEDTAATDPEGSRQPTEPTEDPSWLDFNFNFDFKIELWMILAVCLAVSVGFNVFLLICLFSKRKTGKYAKREAMDEEEPAQEPEE